jgi:K+-sensing histidine kinase KdpD
MILHYRHLFSLLITGKMLTLQVEATIIIIENDQVHKGIVELVNRHGVRKLVMGAVTEK